MEIKSTNVYGYVPSTIDGTELKFEASKTLDVPEEYSYRGNLPKVLDQGENPICVTCSVSAFINWNLNVDNSLDNNTDHDVNLFEIYESKTNRGDGMTFKDALYFLRHTGVSTDRGTAKIEKYAMVGSIDALKEALILNGPCVGALPVYDNSGIKEFWKKKRRFQGMLGGHAISIVGYNKNGFIIRNSWGEIYGDEGYSLLKYEDYNLFFEVWTIIG